jgi:hypothetical protein
VQNPTGMTRCCARAASGHAAAAPRSVINSRLLIRIENSGVSGRSVEPARSDGIPLGAYSKPDTNFRYFGRTRPGTRRTLRGAAIQIAADDMTQHAMARMKASL